MQHLHSWIQSLGSNNHARAARLAALTGTAVSPDAIKDLLADTRRGIPHRYRLIACPEAIVALLIDVVGQMAARDQGGDAPRG